MADDRYITWIKECLAANPHLSQAGLARHLKRSPSSISHLLSGRRMLKTAEIDAIAAYFAVPPPGLDEKRSPVVVATPVAHRVLEVRVMGRIAKGVWIEGDFAPSGPATVPTVAGPKYAAQAQRAFEVGDRDAAQWPELGDYVIAVPATHPERPATDEGDFLVLERERDGLRNMTAVKAERRNESIVLVDMDGAVVTERPQWYVIGSFRRFGGRKVG